MNTAPLALDKVVASLVHAVMLTVRHARQIVVLDGGRIVQQGIHADLCTQEGLYREFVIRRKQAASWKVK